MTQAESLKVFFSYSHEDEQLRHKLEKHLSSLKNSGDISEWFDGKITGGSEIEQNIDENLNASDIILLLISSSYLNSYYCYEKEMKKALQMHAEGKTRVIPIILRPCDWHSEPFGGLKVLPKDGLAVTEWPNEDSALSDIAKGLRVVVEEIKNSRIELNTSDPEEVKKTKIIIDLPAPAVRFVPRHDEHGENLVEKIRQSLIESDNHVVVLWGSGGNGKTTLAAQIARASESEKQIVWVDADGRTDISVGVLLDEIVTQLGQPEARQLPPTLKHEQALALLIEKPSLVILDNFETLKPEYQSECLGFLKFQDFSALITTRERVSGVKNENVFEMSEAEANAFLERLIEDSTFPQAFSDEIRLKTMKIAERNPLVMQWVVGQIGAAQSPKEVFDDLEHGEGEAAERVFNRSFNLPQLGNDGRSILLALSLFVLNARRKSVKEIVGFGQDTRRFNKALKSLANLRLINVTEGSERLFLGGLTRQFARANLDRSNSAKLFRQKFVTYFANFAKAHSKPNPDNLNQLEADKANLFSAVDLAFELESKNLFMLGESLPEFINIRGHWEDGVLVNERILSLAVKLDSKKEIAFFSNILGIFNRRRGNLDKAESFYKMSLEIRKRFGDQLGIAASLHNLGILAKGRGELEEAEHLYRESLEIYKKLGKQSETANSLQSLGNLVVDRGELEEAERLYKESLEISRKLGNQSTIAGTYLSLGILAKDRGELEEADRLYKDSLEISRKLGNQSAIASSLNSLGVLASDRGELEEAETLYWISLEIRKKLGDQSGTAISLNNIGILAGDGHKLEEAEKLCLESLEIAKKLGSKVGIAAAMNSLGKLYFLKEDIASASKYCQESLVIFESLRYVEGINEDKRLIGQIHQAGGNFNEAEKFYKESLTEFRRLGYKNQIALTLKEYASLAETKGEIPSALELLTEAREIFEKLDSPKAKEVRESLTRLEQLPSENN
jgi:tetratricopeptide (TPR) repeat protein/tRNA A37 threonylcarbamoyladenosine biosynthesis protein TsaE